MWALYINDRMRFHVKHWLVQYDPSYHIAISFWRDISFKKSDSKPYMGNHHLAYFRSNPLPSSSDFSGKRMGFPATIIFALSFQARSGRMMSHFLHQVACRCCTPRWCFGGPGMTWNSGWKTVKTLEITEVFHWFYRRKIPHPKVKMWPEHMQREMHSSSNIFQPSYLRDKLAVSCEFGHQKGAPKYTKIITLLMTLWHSWTGMVRIGIFWYNHILYTHVSTYIYRTNINKHIWHMQITFIS